MEKNIVDKINNMISDYGTEKAKELYSVVIQNIYAKRIESPIEQLLYVALEIVGERYDLFTNEWVTPNNQVVEIEGVYRHLYLVIDPQKKIGKYIIDFELSYSFKDKQDNIVTSIVLVECDGHNFHDRNESQRRYEKTRDRYLIKKGYKVLHYTGKEITDNPYNVAEEILDTLIEDYLNQFDEY